MSANLRINGRTEENTTLRTNSQLQGRDVNAGTHEFYEGVLFHGNAYMDSTYSLKSSITTYFCFPYFCMEVTFRLLTHPEMYLNRRNG
jgi:hypothetical protein